jgi:GxxExxY protein
MSEERDPVTGFILTTSIRIHTDLGPGMLETVYEQVLAAALARHGASVARQVPIDIDYDGLKIPGAFKADLIVDDRIVIELKCIERLAPVHSRQLLTYLRLSGYKLGLLINFGGQTLKEGFHRMIL